MRTFKHQVIVVTNLVAPWKLVRECKSDKPECTPDGPMIRNQLRRVLNSIPYHGSLPACLFPPLQSQIPFWLDECLWILMLICSIWLRDFYVLYPAPPPLPTHPLSTTFQHCFKRLKLPILDLPIWTSWIIFDSLTCHSCVWSFACFLKLSHLCLLASFWIFLLLHFVILNCVNALDILFVSYISDVTCRESLPHCGGFLVLLFGTYTWARKRS